MLSFACGTKLSASSARIKTPIEMSLTQQLTYLSLDRAGLGVLALLPATVTRKIDGARIDETLKEEMERA